jgi:hypothetical protein
MLAAANASPATIAILEVFNDAAMTSPHFQPLVRWNLLTPPCLSCHVACDATAHNSAASLTSLDVSMARVGSGSSKIFRGMERINDQTTPF